MFNGGHRRCWWVPSWGDWMFRPRTLKETISLVRMKDEQLCRQQKLFRSPISNRVQPTITRTPPATPIKRLSWEEMQRRRAQGLCFNCNERFTAGRKCNKAQLLIFDSESNTEEATYDESLIEDGQHRKQCALRLELDHKRLLFWSTVDQHTTLWAQN